MMHRMILLPLSVPLVLVAILAASAAVYAILVRRWTRNPRRRELLEWARECQMAVASAEQCAASQFLLELLRDHQPRVMFLLRGAHASLAQIQTLGASDLSALPCRWHVLLRRVEADWPLAGLRPVRRGSCLLDLLHPEAMLAMLPGERFVTYATRSTAAGALHQSSIPDLLPPDIALILAGNVLVLEFSARSFDVAQLQRLLALSHQLLLRLPRIEAGGG